VSAAKGATLMFLGGSAFGATLFVDVQNGACSDAASYAAAQNQATPLCSVAAAGALVRPGDTVKIKAGTYRPSGTTHLSVSGDAGQPITFEPFGDGPVIIAGPRADAGQTGIGLEITGSYVVVQGLELTESQAEALFVQAAHVAVRKMRVYRTDDDGIRVYTGSSDVVIEDNVAWQNGGHCIVVDGTRIVVRNNVGSRSPEDIFEIWPACWDCDVYNNLAHASSRNGFVLGGQTGLTVSANARIYNNISINNMGDAFQLYENGDGGVVLSNNLEFGNSGVPLDTTGTATFTILVATIHADPKIADIDAGDWHLLPGSPAIDTGSATLAPTDDLYGDPRPLGAGIDIGPDEFNDGGAVDSGNSDAGLPDASAADAGANDGGRPDGRTGPRALVVGCGCGASSPGLALAAALPLSRRRRQVPRGIAAVPDGSRG
jgi:hypothetical protein